VLVTCCGWFRVVALLQHHCWMASTLYSQQALRKASLHQPQHKHLTGSNSSSKSTTPRSPPAGKATHPLIRLLMMRRRHLCLLRSLVVSGAVLCVCAMIFTACCSACTVHYNNILTLATPFQPTSPTLLRVCDDRWHRWQHLARW